jgi:hypothetical protein
MMNRQLSSASILSLAFLVLCACGTPTPAKWRNFQQPSHGQLEFDRDHYQCERENTNRATRVVGGVVSAEMETNLEMVDSCMRARGWRKVER